MPSQSEHVIEATPAKYGKAKNVRTLKARRPLDVLLCVYPCVLTQLPPLLLRNQIRPSLNSELKEILPRLPFLKEHGTLQQMNPIETTAPDKGPAEACQLLCVRVCVCV